MAGSSSVVKARRDVFKVFQIWQRVHGAGHDAASASSTEKKLIELIEGHVAGRCALAQSLPRILTKVTTLPSSVHKHLTNCAGVVV